LISLFFYFCDILSMLYELSGHANLHIPFDLDVGLNPLTPITGEWIGSVFTPVDNLTPEQKALIEVSDACVAEMEAADVIVLGVATYNFNIPASLKLWIDYIARQGKTFQYGANGPEG